MQVVLHLWSPSEIPKQNVICIPDSVWSVRAGLVPPDKLYHQERYTSL